MCSFSPRELLVNTLHIARYYPAFQRLPMASLESTHAHQLEQLQKLVAFSRLLDVGADIAAFTMIQGTVEDGGKHHPIVSHVTQRI